MEIIIGPTHTMNDDATTLKSNAHSVMYMVEGKRPRSRVRLSWDLDGNLKVAQDLFGDFCLGLL